MNTPNEPAKRPTRGPARRIAAAVIISGLLFVALWITAFSVYTSLLVASGCCVVVVAASAASDLFEIVLDAIAAIVFGVLAAIAAVFAAIFSIFDF